MKSPWWNWIGLLLVVVLTQPSRSQDVIGGDPAEPANEGEAQDAQPADFDGFGILGQPQGPTAEEQAELDRLNALGLQKAQQGDLEGALTEFEQAIQISPNFTSYLEAGRIFRGQGDVGRAVQNLGASLQYLRNVPEELFAVSATDAYKELGLAYLDAQEFNNAIQTFQQAQLIVGQRRNAELIFNQGLAQSEFALNQQFSTSQARAQDLQSAIALFDKAIEIQPNYAEALYERGNTYFLLGSLDEAFDDLQKAVEIDPENSEAVAQFGFVSLRRGLTEGQLRNADQLQIIEDLNIAVNQFGLFLQMIPRDRDAEEELALEVKRENALISRSAALIGLGDEETSPSRVDFYRRAIADADEALAIVPGLADAHFQKGIAFRMLNDLDEAVEEYTASLLSRPGNTETLLRRGIVYFRQGEFELAQADFTRAVRYSVEPNARGHFWLGLTFSEEGDLIRAIREYNRAIQYQPLYTLAFMNRGLAQMRVGRLQRAVVDFTEVLRREPENEQARSLRSQAKQSMIAR